jgi:hypothetical protein
MDVSLEALPPMQIVKGYQKFMAYLTAQLTDSDLFDASTDKHIQEFLVSHMVYHGDDHDHVRV